MNTVRNLGIWSAVVSAVASVLWFITFAAKDAIAPMPPWTDLSAYAEAFSQMRVLYIYPSLVLPLAFIALLACLHYSVPPEKRVWTLIALAVGVLYAAMASINYNIQAVAVRQSLAAGETAGIEMFLPDNPRSIFGALANSYVYLSLSMVAAGFAFESRGLQRWVRRLLFAQLLTALAMVGTTMFDLPYGLFIAGSMVWVIGAPAAFALIGVLFARSAWEAPAVEGQAPARLPAARGTQKVEAS